MNRTGIEYLDYTWNPFVGCSGAGCAVHERCWARSQARRQLHRCRQCAEFVPHFHPERIHQPLHVLEPSVIGCCFMGDFFDPFMTDSKHGATSQMLQEFKTNRHKVLDIIKLAHRHTFLILTKQPQNIDHGVDFPENLIVGVSVNAKQDLWRISELKANYQGRKAVSFEPLLEDLGDVDLRGIEWVIIGAQTRPEVQPDIKWVRSLADQAREAGVRKITYKDNLKMRRRVERFEAGKLYRLCEDYEDLLHGKIPEGTILRFKAPNLGFASFVIKDSPRINVGIKPKIAFRILEEV
jgi:protein gp37